MKIDRGDFKFPLRRAIKDNKVSANEVLDWLNQQEFISKSFRKWLLEKRKENKNA